MTRRKAINPDWPAVAASLASRVSRGDLHPEAMRRALAEHRRESRRGGRPSRWALAFSGGADSLALLLLLWAEAPGRWDRDFVVLHFNHRLRGRAADDDEEFCREVCAALGVAFVTGRWENPPRAAGEAAARAARHAFFAREMKRRRLRLLWLAHQQDDIAETMLMRLTRGSGTAGLAAPRPVQPQNDGRLHLRPMLTLTKKRIVAALRSAGATWREDESNLSDRFLRNRIRRSILPVLAKASGRDVLAACALSRERLQEDDEALEAWLDELAPLGQRAAVLDLGCLAGKPRALWRRALHRWLLAAQPETDLSRAGFEQLLAAVEQGRDTRFSLGRSAFAIVRARKLSLKRA
ncbi:MAG: tRNA lysidine(34) synthetase TilS [Opitutus sp.]|nr:tRNA lysidine(34) synthetase TilS [Opitutus sp.]